MATRMQQRRGTAAQWTSANPVLAAGEIGFETDTNKFKIGDGVLTWANLDYFATIDEALGDIIDGAPAALNTLNELAAALGDDANYATTITNSLAAKAPFVSKTTEQWEADNTNVAAGTIAYNSTTGGIKIGSGTAPWSSLSYVATAATAQGFVDAATADLLEDSTFTGTVSLPSTTSIGDVSAAEISYLNGLSGGIQGQIDTKLNSVTASETYLPITTASSTYAPLLNPTLTGTVTLPSDTSIGNVSSVELGYVNGVTSAIQTQLDNKADSATVSTTYAPIASPTFTGTVTLPSDTAIGNVSSTELGYLNNVTSAIQTQLDAKAPTASPTFTGTVSGITATMVGLGNVDNTSDANKPVSTATQTALDAKASLSGATFTGSVEIEQSLTVDGNLTVSGTTTTVSAQDLVVSDPLIYIGEGNSANLVDLGLVSSFNDGTYQHAGIVRDSSANKWKLFKGVTDEPTTTVNFAQGSLDDIAVNNVEVAGVVFSDGTQTKAGVPSITTISQKTDSYTLAALTERDTIIEISKASATTLTIPTDATLNFPVGTTLDIIQTGAGQVTIAGAGGVTVNATPGLKLRTQWSSATLLKRSANTWLVYGDLSA